MQGPLFTSCPLFLNHEFALLVPKNTLFTSIYQISRNLDPSSPNNFEDGLPDTKNPLFTSICLTSSSASCTLFKGPYDDVVVLHRPDKLTIILCLLFTSIWDWHSRSRFCAANKVHISFAYDDSESRLVIWVSCFEHGWTLQCWLADLRLLTHVW